MYKYALQKLQKELLLLFCNHVFLNEFECSKRSFQQCKHQKSSQICSFKGSRSWNITTVYHWISVTQLKTSFDIFAGASSWRTEATWWPIPLSLTPRVTPPQSSSTSHTRLKAPPKKLLAHHLVTSLYEACVWLWLWFWFWNLCASTAGAPGGQRHPQPPELCQEKPLQQFQRPHCAALLQVQHQHHGESETTPVDWMSGVSQARGRSKEIFIANGTTLPSCGGQQYRFDSKCSSSPRTSDSLFIFDF